MRLVILLALVSVMGLAHASVRTKDGHPYKREWKKSMYGRRAVGQVGLKAGIGQATHTPRKWGGGWSGFGKRLGAGYATHAVGTTVEHAVAAPLHEDLHYHRSTQKGFGPRLRHALVSTVVTKNTRTGKKTGAYGRLSGHAASGAMSAAIVPAASGAATAGIGLGADAGANVAREFWPRKHKRKR